MINQIQRCPFFSPVNAICAASRRSLIPPAAIRASCCAGEGYEDCSPFLAALLCSLAARLH